VLSFAAARGGRNIQGGCVPVGLPQHIGKTLRFFPHFISRLSLRRGRRVVVSGIGKVVKIEESSFVTDTGREYELPFDLEGVAEDTLNEWLDFFLEQLKERWEEE